MPIVHKHFPKARLLGDCCAQQGRVYIEYFSDGAVSKAFWHVSTESVVATGKTLPIALYALYRRLRGVEERVRKARCVVAGAS